MTSDDFVTGILAALAIQGRTVLDGVDRNFDESMAEAYRTLVADTSLDDLDIDFQISPDPIHGDSSVIQEALTVAVQGRVVARVNPTFRKIRIVLRNDRAKRLLDRLPGGESLYGRLADEFWARYTSESLAGTG